ncbi:ribonuclease HII [Thermatribacter velox]|uniref:Ribonuclease n=1 Tax=Thermatribacter velox TaxID=3039681 RepID=A0ABZ2YAM4_9BACT
MASAKNSASTLKIEEKLWSEGYRFIGGVDEAGRGALGGPLVASCVVLPPFSSFPFLKDSKTLSPQKREDLFSFICEHAIAIGIGMACERLIDVLGINAANLYAFREAISRATLSRPLEFLIFDWLEVKGIPIPSLAFPKAEDKSQSVAAASIVAKVFRDRLMQELYHNTFPEYRFCEHKGYATKVHTQVIRKLGIAKCHRQSFCKNYETKSARPLWRRNSQQMD